MTWWSTNTPSPSCDLCNLEVQPPENVQKFRKERIIFHDFWKLKKIRGCFLESGNFWDVKITQRSFYFGILEKKTPPFCVPFPPGFCNFFVVNKLITSTCSRLVHLPFSCLQINQPNNINQTTNQTQTGFHLHRGETQVTLHLWICSKFQQSYLNKT